MLRKKIPSTPETATTPQPTPEQTPSHPSRITVFNLKLAQIEAMLSIVLMKEGISDGEQIDHEALAKYVEQKEKVFTEHFTQSGREEWSCLCRDCGFIRLIKARQVLGYMRDAQQRFEKEWAELEEFAKVSDDSQQKRFSSSTARMANDYLEKWAKEAQEAHKKAMEMLGEELRLLTAPLKRKEKP